MGIDARYEPSLGAWFGCDASTAAIVALRGEGRRFRPRALIIRAGDKAADAWLMLDGRAQALAFAPGGQFVLVHGFAPGDLFGEATGIALGDAAAEVSAASAVEAGRFSPADFVSLMETYPRIALAVSRQLTRRLTETTRRMVEGATLSAVGRVHAELLRRARATADGVIRPMPVFADLALHVQSTRETVSRTVSTLEKRGIMKRVEGGLALVAPHRLEELVF